MTFAAQITRSPRPFEPDLAEGLDPLFAATPPETREVIRGAAGSSPYLNGLIRKEADWLQAALAQPPQDALTQVLAEAAALSPNELKSGLRRAKRRVALLAGLADLAGVWPLETVTGALTRLADLAVDMGVRALVAAEIDRGKLPGATEADKETAAGMTVLAMGKMGAGELNYSSDIDLICLFDESRFDADDYGEARSAFVRVTRRLTALLSENTGEGYVFRTDLRLRPDPSVTPVCLSMEAAERYYESVGRTWERAAHIKARACAGDIAAGEAYLERLKPFIWRRHLDFAAIQDAHDMRLRIREHNSLRRTVTLEGHDMKLGAGGIREIEFFTQTRQIIAGGRDEGLRMRGTLEGLAALEQKNWIPKDVAEVLAQDYRAHREVEHRVQMINDAQTHMLPTSPDGFERLAALSGRDVDEMRADIRRRLERVSELTEDFFSPDQPAAVEGAPQMNMEILNRWSTYPAMRSTRATEIFARLRPEILSRLQKAARPDEALVQFDRFLAGLPAGVQVFSLFEANPQLIDLLVDIAATAPHLAQYLGRNAQVFDAVIGGDFFEPWPEPAELLAGLQHELDRVDDYEGKLDATRRWRKEWHFRIGVHHLRGLIDADEAGAQYAALADAVLQGLWPVVGAEFAAKHGVAPGRGAVVVGMGSLGSSKLTAASDLDLIMIYDPASVESSDGRRPLATRQYYARLTQALVTALSAPMAEGRLYEVDMRLRPSGRQGPVATSLEAFRTYQQEEAWTWERLALTRARPVAGQPELAADFEAFRQSLLRAKGEPVKTVTDAAEMRERIAAAKPATAIWDAKLGPGRLQDVELLAQSAALIAGDPGRSITEQLAAAQAIGWLNAEQAGILAQSYALMWNLQSAARLLTGDTLDPDAIGQGGTAFLLRETKAPSIEALAKELTRLSGAAAEVIDTALARTPSVG